MVKTPIGRLRLVGLSEGVSFLLLLGVAMPLKYIAGLPIFVKVVGWVHGGLFVLFCVALVHAATKRRWPLLRLANCCSRPWFRWARSWSTVRSRARTRSCEPLP